MLRICRILVVFFRGRAWQIRFFGPRDIDTCCMPRGIPWGFCSLLASVNARSGDRHRHLSSGCIYCSPLTFHFLLSRQTMILYLLIHENGSSAASSVEDSTGFQEIAMKWLVCLYCTSAQQLRLTVNAQPVCLCLIYTLGTSFQSVGRKNVVLELFWALWRCCA